MQLLLVEDHALLGQAMKKALEQEGYDVRWVTGGDEAIASLVDARYDLVLLDLALPKVNGLEVLHLIRQYPDYIPVIIVTARDRPVHRVAGLDSGADDYMVKPIDLAELVARVRAQIRRQDGRKSDTLFVRDVEVDLIGRVVRQRQKIVHLTAKEFKLVALLARRAGRFVSKSDMADELYDVLDTFDGNVIEVSISAIRRKLGADFIITARGLGYTIPK
ncbi:response regulator transcription factor [Gluconacetobacter sp. 1b LMG 1731]|uniref:Response regulator transcription factor n=1 Tax=Gluconacetobacter dulcium TaxID=2729096 RepID=A0A7W4ILR4_9PROT|nr:response regulator transcription factor [Gluconacetobacter dulcium]MBB2165215.1 response regulator transcription factor [Gluconacetobacter dulcium]MBB2194376.1 response regulator transcription factor [Gluconacetobacter dulcium]